MASFITLGGRVVSCSLRVGQPYRRCVVLASVGEGSQATEPAQDSVDASSKSLRSNESASSWRFGSQSTAAIGGGGGSDMVGVLKANRSVRLLRSESKRLGERRLLAFATALSLTTLAWYGQDLINTVGRLTTLPAEDIQGLIYFVIAFNAVSLVLPKSRMSK